MIERSADAWEHNQFKDVIVRAANVEMSAALWLIVACADLPHAVTTRPLISTLQNNPPY